MLDFPAIWHGVLDMARAIKRAADHGPALQSILDALGSVELPEMLAPLHTLPALMEARKSDEALAVLQHCCAEIERVRPKEFNSDVSRKVFDGPTLAPAPEPTEKK